MTRARFVVLVALASCGRSQGVADRDLGGLVVAPRAHDETIVVARAATDVQELGRALALPYRSIMLALGPHVLTITTNTTVSSGETDNPNHRLSELADRISLEIGDAGVFHATYANSADYGREVIFSGGTLYLRPRYQRWHARPPETPDEPEQLRDRSYDAIAATWDLLGFAGEVADHGTSDRAGRRARIIGVTLPANRPAPVDEALDQRKWRETRKVVALTGEVALDVDKGVPLAVKLDGSITFQRDGQTMTMHVSVDASVANIGHATAITVPSGDDVVATPERLREVDDRDFLLQGIAPPLRKEAAK